MGPALFFGCPSLSILSEFCPSFCPCLKSFVFNTVRVSEYLPIDRTGNEKERGTRTGGGIPSPRDTGGGSKGNDSDNADTSDVVDSKQLIIQRDKDKDGDKSE